MFVLSGIHNEISEAPNTGARRLCIDCQWVASIGLFDTFFFCVFFFGKFFL